MTGSLSILNVGAGDISITFNKDDDDEAKKAIKMLQDMMKRGYFVAVQLDDGTYARATAVDATRGRYVVSMPSLPPAETEEVAEAGAPPLAHAESVTCACGCGGAVTPGRKWKMGHWNRKREGSSYKVSVPVKKARAVGIARSAGG